MYTYGIKEQERHVWLAQGHDGSRYGGDVALLTEDNDTEPCTSKCSEYMY